MPDVSLSLYSSYSTLGETYHLIWCGRQLDHVMKEHMVAYPQKAGLKEPWVVRTA